MFLSITMLGNKLIFASVTFILLLYFSSLKVILQLWIHMVIFVCIAATLMAMEPSRVDRFLRQSDLHKVV